MDAAARSWWARESTDALRRRLLVLAVVVALGLVGPIFIALPIFPDPSTSIASEESTCLYDAAPEQPNNRLLPAPTPRPVIAGQPTTLELHVRNSGTCAWDDRITLQREGGSLTEAAQVVSATETASNAFLTARIPLTVPLQDGVYHSTWRMRAPDGRSFGAPLTLSILTHPDGVDPVYPVEPLIAPGRLMTFIALALPGLLGFGLAMERAGRLVSDFYSLKSHAHGRAFVLRRLFNLGLGISAAAKSGNLEVDPQSEAIEKIGGPGSLSVHAETAALLERGGRYSRIVGPGTTYLDAFERVRAVIDLRPLNRRKTESAYSRDGIEVKAETTVSFKLMKQKDDEPIARPEARPSWRDLVKARLGFKVAPPPAPEAPPASPEAIRSIVYELPAGVSWDSTVSSGLADVIPHKMLDELWAPENSERNPRREIETELLNRGKENLRKRGIELIDLTIGPLEVTDRSVDRQRREYWQTHWESRSRVTEAAGEAEALRQQQTARAEAQAELIQAIAHSFRMMAFSGAAQPSLLVALKMLEVIARTMKAKVQDTTADTALLILERLQRDRS